MFTCSLFPFAIDTWDSDLAMITAYHFSFWLRVGDAMQIPINGYDPNRHLLIYCRHRIPKYLCFECYPLTY